MIPSRDSGQENWERRSGVNEPVGLSHRNTPPETVSRDVSQSDAERVANGQRKRAGEFRCEQECIAMAMSS
jgi:hypothetical protein